MIRILSDNLGLISQVCQNHYVKRMSVFGSALGQDYQPGKSDIDLLVEFMPMEPEAVVDDFFDLLDDLRFILKTEVHLIMKDALKNHYFFKEIESTKQALYAA